MYKTKKKDIVWQNSLKKRPKMKTFSHKMRRMRNYWWLNPLPPHLKTKLIK
jgi:hypothetical protein